MLCNYHTLLISAIIDSMGGERKRVQPLNCEEIKKNKTIWCILDLGGFTPIIGRLHGAHANVTENFSKGLKDEKIQIKRRRVEVDEKLIVEVIGLSMEGENFYRDMKLADIAAKKFPKNEKEREKLAKINKSNLKMGNIIYI